MLTPEQMLAHVQERRRFFERLAEASPGNRRQQQKYRAIENELARVARIFRGIPVDAVNQEVGRP